ncbi:MAG: DNA polymerase III [Spirochaetaceae bacterium]|nr:DNA polymerase III [Spirochaetaceae bacterium]
MFENLLHQDNITSRLRHDVAEKSVPPAILFSGPAMSGKLTAALELARSLSCEKEAAWNCSCGHCRAHRSLAHPRTILAGSRDMTPEIAASAEVLRRDTSDAPRFLLARSARKLLRRFDPVLWEGDEKKLVKTRPIMERLAESIDKLLPGTPLPSEKKLEKLLDSLVDDCAFIQKSLPAVLPVSQVRHITGWAVHSSAGDHKTVIIDAAERMPIASRNALLKFLEEPPPDTTAILITDRKSMLLPTIISRLRDYSFKNRSSSEEAEVLRRVFREDDKRWGGLVAYFRAWRNGPSEIMQGTASLFIDHASSGNPIFPKEVSDIRDQLDLVAFLEALSTELQKRWRDSEVPDHKRAAMEIEWLREARIRTESLNMPVPLILRGLYSAMGTR